MSTIEKRPFGNTGETCTAIGMGGGFPSFASLDTSVETVRHGHKLGIRYFDTSPLYCSGASQAIMGVALEPLPKDLICATKMGYFTDARHYRSIEALHVQLQEHLRILRRDSVNLLQVHEADWECWWTDKSEFKMWELFDVEGSYEFASAPIIQFLKEAKERGLCRRIGITGNNSRQIGRLLQELDVDSVLIAYNYYPFNTTARERIIPYAKEKGMAVIVAALLYFVFNLPDDWESDPATFLGKNTRLQKEQLERLQRECQIPMAELALRFVAADKDLSSILLGACHPREIQQSVEAFQKGPLPDDVHAAIEAIAAQFEER